MNLYAIQKISTDFILNYQTSYYNESAPEDCELVDYETNKGIWVTSDERIAKKVLYFSNSVYTSSVEEPRHSLQKEDLQVIKFTTENKIPNAYLEFNSLEIIESFVKENNDILDTYHKKSLEQLIYATKKNPSKFKDLQKDFIYYMFYDKLI